jgi:hypothetical protein
VTDLVCNSLTLYINSYMFIGQALALRESRLQSQVGFLL